MTIYGVLAEKKDAATYMAEALGTITKKDLKHGWIEVNQSILGGKAVITWPDGHVVGLADMASYGDQYAKWDLANLPFLPTHYRFEVAKEGYKRKKFNNVKAALQTVDEIIIATDADREGENIAYSILIKAGLKAKIKWRLWYNSLQKSEFQRAFKNLLPAIKTYPYFVEAQTRQIADWNVGINLTQAYTLHLQQAHLKGTYTAGRVQSPVLVEVVRNDQSIREFKPVPFYQLKGNHQVDPQQVIEFKHDSKFDTKEELMRLLTENDLSEGIHNFQVSEIKTELKHKIAPKLFDLAGIQSYANSHLLYNSTNDQRNQVTTTKSLQKPYKVKFEKGVKNYLERTNHHVVYRVTPIFKDNELLARGLQIEAQSVEDQQIKFNVYILNSQGDQQIDYQTGSITKNGDQGSNAA